MLTERIQALVDRHVAGSPRARELLAALEGRRLQVKVKFTPWTVGATADGGRLVLARHAEGAADVVISGTPLALLALSREAPADVIRRGDVKLDGDADAADECNDQADKP